MKKHVLGGFEKEWAKDNRGRALPYPLVDGDYQSSYFFGLVAEFERALKARVPLTLSIGLLCAIEQAGREVLRFRIPVAIGLKIANVLTNFSKHTWATKRSRQTDTIFSEMA